MSLPTHLDDPYQQNKAGVRFDWGPHAAARLSSDSGCSIVIDVLSFTTSVQIGVERGFAIYPYRWNDESALAFAQRQKAELAVGRSQASTTSPWSLSPAAISSAPFVERLVLSSPNGSTITGLLRGTVLAACLRNASATAQWAVNNGFGTIERPIVIIAAGERWANDDSLRPSLEDLLGAGAVALSLRNAGLTLSPEGKAAADVYAATDVRHAIQNCASGIELSSEGWSEDVTIASMIDVSSVVCGLRNGCFVAA